MEKIAEKILLPLFFLISWALSYYSIRYTEELRPDTEIPMTVVDNVGRNILIFLGISLLVFLLRKSVNKFCKYDLSKMGKIFVIVISLYVGFISLSWISICHVKARADGEALCYVAQLIMEKNSFGTMTPPGYMSYNPHQFSLLAVIHLLFHLFGINNYQSFQYMNALCMPLLFYSGYKLLILIYKKWEPVIYYTLLFLTCLPLFLYIPYVYGEITSITFTMVLMWQVVRYCKTGKKSCFIWGTLAIVFACIMRMNSLIILVACGIVLVVYAIRHAKFQVVIWLLAMVLSIFATDAAIRAYYEKISEREILDGIPYISYVLMGLEDGEKGPGWYNGDNYTQLVLHDYDTELTAIENKQDVKERLKFFWDNKSYGIDFFRRKILSQWNSPAYHSLYETRVFDCEKDDLPMLVQHIYYDNASDVRISMNLYQFLLYSYTAIMVTITLFNKKRVPALENHILIIAIVGGFLFSILWEAMSRYVLPYVVYMIPLAAVGMWQLQDIINYCIEKMRKK